MTTTYIILRESGQPVAGGGHYDYIGTTRSSNAVSAAKAAAGEDSGFYVAIPVRNFTTVAVGAVQPPPKVTATEVEREYPEIPGQERIPETEPTEPEPMAA